MKDIIEDFQNEENPREYENFHTLKPSINQNQLNEFSKKKTEIIYIQGVEF